jgi:hypothetical protein
MSIKAKDAIRSAMTAAVEFFENAAQLRLEEVTRDELHWYVTVSFVIPSDQMQPEIVRALMPNNKLERTFKRFEIDAQTGEALGVTIRQI